MQRSFKYKLRSSKVFFNTCDQVLESCRELYNAALSQRISAYKLGQSISFMEQSRQLTEARELPEVGIILRSFQVDVLRRLDKAYGHFFRRVKTGSNRVGFPRFKSRDRYCSFGTWDAREFRLEGDKLIVNRIGSCRLRLSWPLQGRPRTLSLQRAWDGWYAVITCDNVEPRPLPLTGASAGIDVGLENFATLSDGSQIKNPRYFRKGEVMLAHAQQNLARKVHGGKSRTRARRLVARAHAKIQRQRDWFHWRYARSLVSRFDVIVVEKLNVKGLIQTNLAKSIHDAGWASFIEKLLAKAEEAGREVVRVSARFTSQDCSGCGKRKKKDLSERWHSCECGVSLSRDHNAAINILGRAVPDLKIEPAHAGG